MIQGKNSVIIVIVLIIIALIGWYVFNEVTHQSLEEEVIVTEDGFTITADSESEPIVDVIPSDEILQLAPSLARTVVFPERYSGEVQTLLGQQLDTVRATLQADPTDVSGWIELGVLLKSVDDYTGAEETWLYATVLAPEYYLSFANLGDLYAYYLNDAQKAEESFLKAVEYGSEFENVFVQTAEFYRNIRNDEAKAKGILAQYKK